MSEISPQSELRDWLRSLKDSSKASYREIAIAIGEEERTVKRWMTGDNPSTPAGDSLLRLLDYFGVTLTPPAPRAVAVSLMGELREVREDLARLEGVEGSDDELSLRRMDRRLTVLGDRVAEAVRLLRELAAQQSPDQAPGKTPRTRKKAAR
jgi:transcriptional regulator with XRE-family HTH domain